MKEKSELFSGDKADEAMKKEAAKLSPDNANQLLAQMSNKFSLSEENLNKLKPQHFLGKK